MGLYFHTINHPIQVFLKSAFQGLSMLQSCVFFMIIRIFQIPKYFAPDFSTLQIVILKKTFLIYRVIDTVFKEMQSVHLIFVCVEQILVLQNCDLAIHKDIFKVFENSQRFLRTDGLTDCLTDLYRLINQQSDALVISNQITTKISHMLVFRFFRCP